ncbi:MAG: hypothetical protein PVF65_09775 [Sphingomonadales bacterium]|jgi:hypothetical protein
MSLFLKNPNATLDFSVDWDASYLAGQSITNSLWRVEPDNVGGVAIVNDSFDGAVTAVTLTGGVFGHQYQLSNQITLSNGLIDERSFVVRVGDTA